MTEEEKVRLFLAQSHAHSFQAGFERCWNTGVRDHDVIKTNPLAAPALICALLSVEIGLKALLRQHGNGDVRGHNLASLLDKLPPEVLNNIKQEVIEQFPDFDELLEDAKNAFVDWRYFYEKEEAMGIDILFVGALGAAVQKEIGLEVQMI